MNRAITTLLALLLVLSLTVAPGMADSGSATNTLSETPLQNQVSSAAQTDSSPQPVENTTNRLSLGEPSRSEYTEYGPDLGATLASTDDKLRIDQTQYAAIDREFDDASSEERRALLQGAYDRLTERSDALEAREQRAVRAHASGEISTNQLLQTLLRNYREASVLSEEFDELAERSDLVSNVSLSIKDEQGRLEMHRTEIRSQLELAAYGNTQNGANNYITVETSENGYVISTLDEDYIREATRFDSRTSAQPSQFNNTLEAYGYAQEQYPWAYDTGQSPSFDEHTTVQLYLFDIRHDHGNLEAYLDGGTGKIYREMQTLNKKALPKSGKTKTMVKNGTEIKIEETTANGPVNVTVTDSETTEPTSATIVINGFEVGETKGSDSLWYVPPTGEYELTARMSTGDSINTTVSSS
ncbi:DUF7096 domain-containing protein [Natrinema sp. LN54]|uniref:DUF7096 domain-containing protein n=1 Tax=Natrinema sp. LN54 TaxID=3458705 RepID=UPI0040367132